MTTIICNIKVAGTTENLVGYVRVNIPSTFSDEDTLYVPVFHDYDLVDGSVTFELEPSDLARVAYKFEIWQLIPDEETIDDLGNPVTIVNADILVKSFSAVVPFSSTPINIKDLAEQSGVRYDAQDASLLTLSRYLYSNDTFWEALVNQVFQNKGAWSPSVFYKRGDVVSYDGSGYQYVATVASQGNLTTDETFWRLLVSRGETGTGTAGNDTIYGASWDGATDAPTRNALYDIIQTLATKNELDTKVAAEDAVLTGNPTATTQATGNRSTRIATTDFVGNELDGIGRVSIGDILIHPTTAAPNKYRVLTNPGEVVSQTTYAELFAQIGTTYNTGSEGAGNFRLPSNGGGVPFGDTRMRWVIYTGV
ncbi:MAG: phage tail protein [Trichormus sp. ATA11-4-KO1]|jgi:hypothetical protein|nr:phage tail protein [Trichormus sp. ATA11-4-KO1]